jgi:hypothetical protein
VIQFIEQQSNSNQQTTNNKQQSTINKQQTTNNKQQITINKPQSTNNNQIKSISNQIKSISNQSAINSCYSSEEKWRNVRGKIRQRVRSEEVVLLSTVSILSHNVRI